MRVLVIAALFALPVPLFGCGSSEPTEAEEDARLDEAYDRASDDVSSESYEDVGDTSLCTDDCSGHDAGFEWAKENGVTDPADCGGESQSFQEGCEAYGEAIDEEASAYGEEGEDE
ncbi:hypothetical protein [Sphingomonas alba]|uniref:Uncharacterized protein n=1 Tax=Sphingomonas alba TaxID=2908208 RepID=A0ABT0RP87_9SPHN|nr:hypothetical protein [Sphingomonas alba]MCL6684467.1 hypothetical protein [Sphingomonas alba]